MSKQLRGALMLAGVKPRHHVTSVSGEEERLTLPMWSVFKEKEQRGRQDLIFHLKIKT